MNSELLVLKLKPQLQSSPSLFNTLTKFEVIVLPSLFRVILFFQGPTAANSASKGHTIELNKFPVSHPVLVLFPHSIITLRCYS